MKYKVFSLYASALMLVLTHASPSALAENHETQDVQAAAAAAEQESVLTADVAALQESYEELETLRQQREAAPDDEKDLLTPRIREKRRTFRRNLYGLADTLASDQESGPASDEVTEAVRSILGDDAEDIEQEYVGQKQRIKELITQFREGDESAKLIAESRLKEEIPASDAQLDQYHRNLLAQRAVGLDPEELESKLLLELPLRAELTTGMLKAIRTALDLVEVSADPSDPTRVARTRQLKELRRVYADSLRRTLAVMEARELPTSDYDRALIELTGELSNALLDIEVLGGIVTGWFESLGEWIARTGPNLFFQLLVFVAIILAFRVLARLAERAVSAGIDRSKLQFSRLLRDFFIKSTGRVVLVFGVIIAISQMGVQVGPVLAGLGIAGFIVGFALQDVLSNFASGMMILLYRPFDVGDVIEAGGVSGKVSDMTLVSTKVLTFDNQMLVVPNNKIWGDVIRNVTHQDKRRVDLVFGIGYEDDIEQAERILEDIVAADDRILKDPAPTIRLHTLNESSVDFVVRPWVATDDYWDVYWDLTREVKRRFDAEGVSIPFPQRDVHVYQHSGSLGAPEASNEGLEVRRTTASGRTEEVELSDD